ncbi:hypothetical protein [Mucilaginibacter kameinonensis]|uniref:hypothetical protein n=1 Tax=Mucilaginibacter kameinonensis TaxID=452286 RepID=UPI000EF7B00B|nr:hypothetical protein [Mucilaginibacter kameinonensis]
MFRVVSTFKFYAIAASFVLLLSLGSAAQGYDPSKIIPPTPTAAALGAFGNYTVGNASGRPNISVPLYNIKSHDNSLDISLNYDASGVRVCQDASWVGLNWSLVAGGVITRTVRGYDDFKDAGGYYYASDLPQSTGNGLPMPGDRPAFDEVLNGRTDMEPDIYNYNFGPYAGKFVLGKQANGSKAFFDERNNLKVEYISGNWTITDTKGYKYNFTVGESAANYGYSNANAQMPVTTGLTGLEFQQTITTTGWYLSSIVSPNNDIINFNYERGESLSLISFSETQYDQDVNLAQCLFQAPYSQASEQYLSVYRNYSAARQVNNEVYLKSITYNNGSVEFNTTDRKDIDFQNNGTKHPAKLSTMVIYDKDHLPLKTYTFSYTYFKDNANGTETATSVLRLRLDAITESDGAGVAKPPYQFTYNSATDLPDKYSKDIDHWGYYNQAINSRLLPMPASIIPSGYLFNSTDANREPDVTHDFYKLGLLASIKYPTGGHTDFDYEMNEYGHLQPGETSRVDQNVGYAVSSNPFNQFGNSTVTFDINDADLDQYTHVARASLHTEYTYISGTKILQGVSNNYGYLSGPNGAMFSNDIQADPTGTHGSKDILLNLPAGHYTMLVNYTQGYSVSANLVFTLRVLATQKKGDGARISRITTVDNIGVSQIKKYQYTNDDGSSSGKLLMTPTYGFRCPAIQIVGQSACNPTSMYVYRVSGNAYPSGLNSKNSGVSYDKVTELAGENGEGGKTEYYYLNKESWALGDPAIPGAPMMEYEKNGKLDKQIEYNAAGQVLKIVQNDYVLKDVSSIPSAVLYKGPPIPTTFTFVGAGDMPTFQVNNGNPYSVYFYGNLSNWLVLNSTTVTENFYRNNIKESLNSMTNYYYDNFTHQELTREVVTRSDGKVQTTVTNYPDDYPSGTMFIDDMKTSHLTSLPIEQVTYQDSGPTAQVISGTVTQYKTGGKGQVDQAFKLESLPLKTLSAFKFSNSATGQLPSVASMSAYAKDGSYNAKATVLYDAAGNVQMVTPVNSNPIVFIWGYNRQFPVAKIENSDYATVLSALGGQTALDSFAQSNPTDAALSTFLAPLRSNPSLKTSLVTTFTYIPGTGMTSLTDPKGLKTTFEYDSFQRLKNVKDKDLNITEAIRYHYQQ